MSQIRNILDGHNIGDPFMVTGLPGREVKIYGRLTDFAGTEYDGQFPQVVVTTPSGSDVTVGRAWCHLVTDPDELAELTRFEGLAQEKGEWYGGKLPICGHPICAGNARCQHPNVGCGGA